MKTMSRCLVFALGIILLAGCASQYSAKTRAQARKIAQRKSAARNSSSSSNSSRGGQGTLIIIKDPATQVIALTNLVEFAVITYPSTNVLYQWFFNNTEIMGSTNREHIITNAAFSDVGEYSVRATLGATNVYSAIAYLSVYQLWATNSNGGVLTSPAGVFTSVPTTSCGTFNFTSSYAPQDDAGLFYFYGPYVPLSAQYGPFKNTSYCKNLRITTAGQNPTAVAIGQKLFKGTSSLWCESGMGGGDRTQFNLDTRTTASLARYQCVFYSGALPAFSVVSFYWEYNGSPTDE